MGKQIFCSKLVSYKLDPSCYNAFFCNSDLEKSKMYCKKLQIEIGIILNQNHVVFFFYENGMRCCFICENRLKILKLLLSNVFNIGKQFTFINMHWENDGKVYILGPGGLDFC